MTSTWTQLARFLDGRGIAIGTDAAKVGKDTDAAYRLGYDLGYEAGHKEGRGVTRPVVVPLKRGGL